VRRALLDGFIWLELITIVPFVVRLATHGGDVTPVLPKAQRVLESLSSLRLLKLCRYYEGAGLLARAFYRSAEQLAVHA